MGFALMGTTAVGANDGAGGGEGALPATGAGTVESSDVIDEKSTG